MGRIVVLQFENTEVAERWLEDLPEEQLKVVGEYYLPPVNLYCKCVTKTRLRTDNWRRHKKFGLYICKTCKLPSRHWRVGVLARLGEALGRNLLDNK